MFTLNVVGSGAGWPDLRVSVAMILDVCAMSFFVGLIVFQRLAAIRKEKVQVSSGIIRLYYNSENLRH